MNLSPPWSYQSPDWWLRTKGPDQNSVVNRMFEIFLIISMYGVVISIEAILRYRKRKKKTKEMIEKFEKRHPVNKDING